MIAVGSYENEEKSFGEFRRKVRSAEVLWPRWNGCCETSTLAES